MNIKEIRAMTGLSQTKFAEKYGIPRITIIAWEQGRRNPPPYVPALLERVVKMDVEQLKDEIREKVQK